MKIFIDFDDVIFYTKKFKNDLISIFLKNGVTRQEFENSYYTFQKKAQARGEYYDPKKQIQVLKKRNQIDQRKLSRDIDKFLKSLEKYVFSDVLNFLSHFPKKDLYLITYGHEIFQMKKIKGAGIKKYFKRIIVSKNNKLAIILETAQKDKFSPGEKMILIDDRPEQLERVEQRKKSVITFHMCRPQGRYSDLICADKDYEVKNLKEILSIINREIL